MSETSEKTISQVFDEAVEKAREDWMRRPWESPLNVINAKLREIADGFLTTEGLSGRIEERIADQLVEGEQIEKVVNAALTSTWHQDHYLRDAVTLAVAKNQPAIDAILAKIVEERGVEIVEEMFRKVLSSAAQQSVTGIATTLFGNVGSMIQMAITNARHTPGHF